MKKLVFTIQIIALIAIFPAYLVAELSHEKIATQAKNPAPATGEATEKNNVEITAYDAALQFSYLIIK
jgi:hypothetical protein